MAGTERTVGLIGVGSMGRNIANNLYGSGCSLVLYNKAPEACAQFVGRENISIAESISDLAKKARGGEGNAVVWLMIPPGKETNDVVYELSGLLRKGDIVIDASNSEYPDSMSNYNVMMQRGINYLDVGCAGGPNDLLTGVALMVGGNRDAYDRVEDVLKAVAKGGSYGYVGASGAGHMAKLAHNMIFYGIFPVISEGIDMLNVTTGRELHDNFDMKEAIRLFGAAPPITNGIQKAIGLAMQKGLPEDAPVVTLSSMVRFGVGKANESGLELNVINSVLNAYGNMSRSTRTIYHSAKKILTGH